jgi:hypothetical protein
MDKRIQAWIGSILFHFVILVLFLLWFSLAPIPKFAPGERTAVGGIVLNSSAESPPDEMQFADSSSPQPTESTQPERLSDVYLSYALPASTPAQNTIGIGPSSATEITDSLDHGSVVGKPNFASNSGGTTVRVFGTEGKGTKFLYVFDRSGSMEGKLIRAAKAELVQSLVSLGNLHQFNIIFYSTDYLPWRTGRKLIFATDVNKENASQFVAGITPTGGTGHFLPLLEAVRHRPDVIFFLTDGERQDDLTDAQLSEIDKVNSRFGGAQINVIQFGRVSLTDPPSDSLKKLAVQNHGQYRYIPVKE